jgi:hypothetical protein
VKITYPAILHVSDRDAFNKEIEHVTFYLYYLIFQTIDLRPRVVGLSSITKKRSLGNFRITYCKHLELLENGLLGTFAWYFRGNLDET